MVGFSVVAVTTTVNIQSCSQRNGSGESEESRQSIGDHEYDWNVEGFHDGSYDSVYNDEPREDSNEHGIVDCGGVTIEGIVNYISNQSCNDESQEEL